MRSLAERRAGFINGITENVVRMIAKDECISLAQATKDFENSRTYNFLTCSDDPFVEDGPEDFYDLYKNEKKYHRLVSSTQLYLEKHPEMYEGSLR